MGSIERKEGSGRGVRAGGGATARPTAPAAPCAAHATSRHVSPSGTQGAPNHGRTQAISERETHATRGPTAPSEAVSTCRRDPYGRTASTTGLEGQGRGPTSYRTR